MIKYYFLVSWLLLFGFVNLKGQKEVVVKLSDPGKKGLLEIDLMRGSLKIIGKQRADFLFKFGTDQNESIKLQDQGNGLKKIVGGVPQVEIEEHNNEVHFESNFLSQKGKIKLTVEVPLNTDMDLTLMEGEIIEIENVNGEISLECMNGAIVCKNIAGSMLANTFNGEISVEFDKIDPDAPLAFTNFNGTIDLTFPSDLKANFQIRRMGKSDIYTGFDMDLKPASEKRMDSKNEGLVFSSGLIEGIVNGGGNEIRIETHQGDIYIRKKE